jgi:hypothetical protein
MSQPESQQRNGPVDFDRAVLLRPTELKSFGLRATLVEGQRE